MNHRQDPSNPVIADDSRFIPMLRFACSYPFTLATEAENFTTALEAAADAEALLLSVEPMPGYLDGNGRRLGRDAIISAVDTYQQSVIELVDAIRGISGLRLGMENLPYFPDSFKIGYGDVFHLTPQSDHTGAFGSSATAPTWRGLLDVIDFVAPNCLLTASTPAASSWVPVCAQRWYDLNRPVMPLVWYRYDSGDYTTKVPQADLAALGSALASAGITEVYWHRGEETPDETDLATIEAAIAAMG